MPFRNAFRRLLKVAWPPVFALVVSVSPALAQAAAPADPAITALIEDIAVANRILADQQVLDAYGHVSARHPANANRFLMGRNLAPALVMASDIVEYDLD